jgi:hypothetical protein
MAGRLGGRAGAAAADVSREVPVRFRAFRVEHLRHVGWQAYPVESYVNWCGHAHEVILPRRKDGSVVYAATALSSPAVPRPVSKRQSLDARLASMLAAEERARFSFKCVTT